MPDLYDEIRSWPAGVVTSVMSDQIPKSAVQRADNAQLVMTGPGEALFRKRQGLSLCNREPLGSTGAPPYSPVVGQFPYPYLSGGTQTYYQARLTADGDLFLSQDSGTDNEGWNATSYDLGFGAYSPLSVPDFATAKSQLFVLDGKGHYGAMKGTSIVPWGTAPVTGVGAAVNAAAGSMTGSYDVVVTRYDPRTDNESEWSDIVSASPAAQQLDVTLTAPGSPYYTRVYLRKPSLGGGFYRVLAGTGGYDSTYEAFDGTATTITLNVSDTVFVEDWTTAINPVGTQSPPPSDIKHAAWFRRRMFVATDTTIYWSKEDNPHAFNLTDDKQEIVDDRGGVITALKVAFDRLLIFTPLTRWELIGADDPRTWDLRLVDTEMGLEGHRSFIVYDGAAYWWNREHGPVRYDGTGVNHIGTDLIRDKVRASAINPAYIELTAATGAADRVLFFVPDPNQTTLTRLLVWNTVARAWESTRWDPMDGASLATMLDSDGIAQVYLGNNAGQVFRMFTGSNDGVRTGTTTGTFVAAATSVSSITDGTASFNASAAGDAGLLQRKVTIIDNETREPVTETVRPHITAVTATVLTLSTTISGFVVGRTYRYMVGGPDFILDTYDSDLGQPFVSKRFDQAFMQFEVDDGVSEFRLDAGFDFDRSRTSEVAATSESGSYWDVGYWDSSYWDETSILTRKTWLGKVGRNIRLRLRSPEPDQGFTLMKVGVLARQLTDRYPLNL
jgi:hypothetical protein